MINRFHLILTFIIFTLSFNMLSAQREDLPPLIQCDVDSLIAETDSVRFRMFPVVYHAKYMLMDKSGTGGWPPIPFMPDVFVDMVNYPDSGVLGIQYGRFQAQSLSFYDYGGVHFTQVHLAPEVWIKTDSGKVATYPDDEMVTITLASSFGRAWVRFDEEAESDNWLETFVEKDMAGFGPEISEVRKGSSGENWLMMFGELWSGVKQRE